MDVQSWIPVVTALISTAGALVSVWYGRRAARIERLAGAEELAIRFREPLVQAVFNLETRLYNIVAMDFLRRFGGAASTQDERDYAEHHTLYVFGQYFCWVEILRRESEFLDPRHLDREQAVVGMLEDVREILCDSWKDTDPAFRLFRGQQRAMGEVMLVAVEAPIPRTPRWACLGYADFVEAIDTPRMQHWFGPLRADLGALAATGYRGTARLRAVQLKLVDILDALDPDCRRIPENLRRRLDPPASGAAAG